MIDDSEKKVWKPDIADLARMWSLFLDGRRISLTGRKRKIRG